MTETTMVTTPRTSTDVATREARELAPAIAGDFEGGLLTLELVEQIEKQVVFTKRMRLAVCRLTEAGHWMDIGGNPYLKDAGIHTIASTIGVEFAEPQIAKDEGTDERGQFVNFVCSLSATWRGRRLFEVGTSSTRDDFFGKSKGGLVAFIDINLGNVLKKSVTNAQHRILTKITGLGGVTWELLETIGIRRGAGGQTRFKGHEQKQATGAGEWTPAKEKLQAYLVELAGGADAAADMLLKRTANPERGFSGVRDVAQLSSKQVEWLLPKVEGEWKKAFGAPEPEPQVPPNGGAPPAARTTSTPWTADKIKSQEREPGDDDQGEAGAAVVAP